MSFAQALLGKKGGNVSTTSGDAPSLPPSDTTLEGDTSNRVGKKPPGRATRGDSGPRRSGPAAISYASVVRQGSTPQLATASSGSTTNRPALEDAEFPSLHSTADVQPSRSSKRRLPPETESPAAAAAHAVDDKRSQKPVENGATLPLSAEPLVASPPSAQQPQLQQPSRCLPRNLPKVVNVRKAELVKLGYQSFLDWAADPTHVYIGRCMERYVPGTTASKWGNPFPLKQYTLEESLSRYEAHVRSSPELMASLPELLAATEIGCWCHPSPCHGNVLVRLLAELDAPKRRDA